MLKVRFSARFKKDFKTIVKRGYDVSLFEKVRDMLRAQETLPEEYHDHALKCHYGD